LDRKSTKNVRERSEYSYGKNPMTSSCAIRRRLAERLAVATRLYAESAVCLATSGKSSIDFIRLSKETIEAQSLAEAACRAFMDHVGSHQCGDAMPNGNVHLHLQQQHVS